MHSSVEEIFYWDKQKKLDYFKKTPPVLAGVVNAFWFDDFDYSQILDQEREFVKLHLQTKNHLMDMLKKSNNPNSIIHTHFAGIIYIYDMLCYMGVRYQHHFGNIVIVPERRPIFAVELNPHLEAIGQCTTMMLDKTHGNMFMKYEIDPVMFAALQGLGAEHCLLPHEGVHFWQGCKDTHHMTHSEFEAVAKDWRQEEDEYLSLCETRSRQRSRDSQHRYHDAVTGMMNYEGMLAQKMDYSNSIAAEGHVTEFFQRELNLTHREAVEVAHAPFLDCFVQVAHDQALEASDVAYVMKSMTFPFMGKGSQRYIKSIIKKFNRVDDLQERIDAIQKLKQAFEQSKKKIA
tara:strand:+ start:9247 stop:10284 length:1038 start_codon:yes stop_codon:yes gene_type:complete